jgi:hypothetical protein
LIDTYGRHNRVTVESVVNSLFILFTSGVEGGVGEAYEDIRTVVLGILQAEFCTAPASEQGESKMQSSCFS